MCEFPLYRVLQNWWKKTQVSLVWGDYIDLNELLISATSSGCLEIYELLMSQNLDVNYVSFKHPLGSPLIAAISRNDEQGLQLAQSLIYEGADVELVLFYKSHSTNALEVASSCGNAEVIELLIEHGADPNLEIRGSRYGRPIAAAIHANEVEFVRLLVAYGADVDDVTLTDDFGTPLIAASALNPNTEILGFLLHWGAAPNFLAVTGKYGSALIAATASQLEQLDKVQLLVQYGADINCSADSGIFGSPLIAAAYSGNLEIVKWLAERGADINFFSDRHQLGSALASAAWTGRVDVVEYLLQREADPNLEFLSLNEYRTALEAALLKLPEEELEKINWNGNIDSNKAEVAKILQEHGANPCSDGGC